MKCDVCAVRPAWASTARIETLEASERVRIADAWRTHRVAFGCPHCDWEAGMRVCRTCAVHGPDRSQWTGDRERECGCHVTWGRCAYHAMMDGTSAETRAEWEAWARHAEWADGHTVNPDRGKAYTTEDVTVEAWAASHVVGRADVVRAAFNPDGMTCEVTYRDRRPAQVRSANIYAGGLSADLETALDAMSGPHDVRGTWSRWPWRTWLVAMNVCRECGARTSALRTSPHVCGETLDKRGRAIQSPEARAVKQRGIAAAARIRFALKRGKSPAAMDVESVRAAGMDVPTL